jgi:hypothetical protein
MNDHLAVMAFPGVSWNSQGKRWCLHLPGESSQSFKSEKEAARAYGNWLAHHNKQPKATSSQYRGEPLRADVTGPPWP